MIAPPPDDPRDLADPAVPAAAPPAAPRLEPEGAPPEPPKGWKRARIPPLAAVVGVLGGIVVALGANLALALIPAVMIAGEGVSDPATAQERVMEIVMTLPFVAGSVLLLGLGLVGGPMLAAAFSKTSFREGLGFRGAHPLTFVLGPIGILSLGPVSDLLVRTMKAVFPDWSFGALDSIEALTHNYSFWALFPFIALVPGFTEEIFFRGLIQRSMGNVSWKAILVSAVGFSFFHMDPHHVAGVLPLGLFLAWLAARTGSLWVTIVTHAANNATALLASQVAGVEADAELPWFVLPIGLGICTLCVAGIYWATRDRARHSGPVSAPNGTERIVPPRGERTPT
ncbi:MAG: hypothetical protein CMN30_01120 [Sandaracinus sp.]|nr:hypothetical protein [Sandaracinus sp.]